MTRAYPADAVATLRLDIASTTAYLKNNPTDGSEWLQLAIYYKIAGDYTAAASVWTYLTQVAPASYVAFANLGDLYQNFDINYPKAEANYLQAIKLNPQDVDIYADLYNLYRYEYKVSTTSAAAIVAQGLKANPGNLGALAAPTANTMNRFFTKTFFRFFFVFLVIIGIAFGIMLYTAAQVPPSVDNVAVPQ